MITKQQINELDSIITYLNQAKSLENNKLKDKVEDMNQLVKTLTKVKVSKLKKLNNTPSQKLKKEKILENNPYTKDDVIELFTKLDRDQIVKTYTAMQLKKMFIAVYGKMPLSKFTKKDIVIGIMDTIYESRRNDAIRKLKY